MFAKVLKSNKTLKLVYLHSFTVYKGDYDIEEIDEVIVNILEINTPLELIYFPLHATSVYTLRKICNSLKMNCNIIDENITLTDKIINNKGATLLIDASNIRRILTALYLRSNKLTREKLLTQRQNLEILY